MSQTQHDPTQPPRQQAPAPTAPVAPPPPAGTKGTAGASADDPLARLHKMSTTAGLGSGEYVAVNGTAVFALLLGLASALVLLEDLLLIIPLVGLVAGVVAMRQIGQSNGTQTGKGLVALALVLCLAFGGWVIFRKTTEGMRTRADRQAIASLVTQLGEHLVAGNNDAAYGMFTGNFQGRLNRQVFEERASLIRENPTLGKLKGTATNGLVDFQVDETTGARYATAVVEFRVEKSRPDMQVTEETTLRKEGDRWLIESMPTVFSPPRAGRGQPQ